MSKQRWGRWPFAASIGGVLVAGLGLAAYFLWFRPLPLPGPESPRYREYAESFQVGLAALDTERSLEIGGKQLDHAIQIVPEEPAAWANRGLMRLRSLQLKEAADDIGKAHDLAPESGEIEALLGWLAQAQGKYSDAVGHLQKAVKTRPRNLLYLYALADAVDKERGPDADAQYQRLIEEGLKIQPNNLFLLRERLGTAVNRGDRAAVEEVTARFRAIAPEWNEGGREELANFIQAAQGPLPGDAQAPFIYLSNTLASQRGYQRNLAAVVPPGDLRGEPVAQFLRLAPMPVELAAPDLGVTFTSSTFTPAGPGGARAAWVAWLNGQECQPAVFVADGAQVRRADAEAPSLAFPGGPQAIPPSAHGLVAADFYNHFRTDLLLAGAGGLRFFAQKKPGEFIDVSKETGLPVDVLSADYYGALAADVDMDGDLDFIVAPRTGAPFVLRNNGDGTFKVVKDVFPNVSDVRGFAWADFDHDGAPDVAFLDAHGKATIFLNQRHGKFTLSALPDAAAANGLALAVADANDDGVLDLLILDNKGAVRRLSNDEGDWTSAELAQWQDFSPGEAGPGDFQLLAADLDNNGAIDLIAAGPSGARIWMGAGPDKFQPLPATIAERVFAAADLDGDGRLDLLALSADGHALRLHNRGVKNYHWRDVRPYANRAEQNVPGDNRINSFGIGAEAEIRTGLLVQMMPVTAPSVHFGLGEYEKAQVFRIVWPNGDPQVEFGLEPAQPCLSVAIQQRLKGSCPFLFTWDGERMQFVADVLWSSPLGLYINAQDRGGIAQTTDWVKVRGDQLQPRDGHYDVRITADLWETHYFDHVHLNVVDHPADTELFADERFFLTPTAPQLYLTKPPRPIARAVDDNGDDVTDVVRRIDGRYLDTFGRGKYQGVTRDHYVEVDLGDDAPKTGPFYLLAHGWIHPTDSSINVAIEQGANDRPHGLVLEVPDGKGGWKVGRPALGFPAGKNKTIVIRLDDIPGQEGVARRFRLRTNMEIYWDALEYAEGLDAGRVVQNVLQPETAELRHRGISRIAQADASSPELPDYDKLISRSQYWRDLIGWYTRYGDVRELLEKIDDRYVIMNAGDEIALRFAVPPEPPQGWKRDFIWVSDGWEKDGDFNTRWSKTVLPLPYHGMTDYETPPGRLQDDPVYRKFPDDWKKYHTRYVTPFVFERGLRPYRP